MTEGDSLITLTATRIGSAAVVTVAGELDLHTARNLMGTVDETLAWPDLDKIVIDLSAVTFLGSSGLGTLAELATRTPAAASRHDEARPVPVRLVAPPDNRAVLRPWEVMKLEPILPLFPDLTSALDAR
ncbi:MAG TPA: STAS domain-containing protein [Pseudonocardia sp.]